MSFCSGNEFLCGRMLNQMSLVLNRCAQCFQPFPEGVFYEVGFNGIS